MATCLLQSCLSHNRQATLGDIFLAIDRPDMRGVSIAIGASDPRTARIVLISGHAQTRYPTTPLSTAASLEPFAEMFDSILDCSLVVRDLVHERNNAALQGRPYTHERLGQSKALYTCNEIVDVGWR